MKLDFMGLATVVVGGDPATAAFGASLSAAVVERIDKKHVLVRAELVSTPGGDPDPMVTGSAWVELVARTDQGDELRLEAIEDFETTLTFLGPDGRYHPISDPDVGIVNNGSSFRFVLDPIGVAELGSDLLAGTSLPAGALGFSPRANGARFVLELDDNGWQWARVGPDVPAGQVHEGYLRPPDPPAQGRPPVPFAVEAISVELDDDIELSLDLVVPPVDAGPAGSAEVVAQPECWRDGTVLSYSVSLPAPGDGEDKTLELVEPEPDQAEGQ